MCAPICPESRVGHAAVFWQGLSYVRIFRGSGPLRLDFVARMFLKTEERPLSIVISFSTLSWYIGANEKEALITKSQRRRTRHRTQSAAQKHSERKKEKTSDGMTPV